MNKFKLKSDFKATRDQKNAVDLLVSSIKKDIDYQVLLGVTGSGKTFTIANAICEVQKPALVISHNKTLAAQLYQEFRDFFPDNAVSYFVSYYDYYQPEAYIPSTDTYIEKDADINELIDKLRLETTTNLLTRNDTIVVASVSCIYNIGAPSEYRKFVFEISEGQIIERDKIINSLIDLQYERGEFGFHRGTFRVRGETIDIYPAYSDSAIRIELRGNRIDRLKVIDPLSGSEKKVINSQYVGEKHNLSKGTFTLFPAKHYITDPSEKHAVFSEIEKDLVKREKELKDEKKILEAHRLSQRVKYDLEMIKEVGYVKGIENYSRYFDGRKPGEAPFTLLDYFNHPYKDDWLLIVDESHITFPQIRGMFAGDLSRKKTLVDHGFRLPAAFDNRPLTFNEFLRRIPGFIATSATPSDWEVSMAKESSKKSKKHSGVVEQLLRPTGIPDPEIQVKPVKNQVQDVISEIKKIEKRGLRALITTLTKKTAEDLAEYLKEKNIKVHYLHSDVKTLERTEILDELRRGKYVVIVGVNLLREGLDLPEVALVAILDADKEGFLRSEVSLIQTMGRAARHVEGRVILYADKETRSMRNAMNEVDRRRKYQIKMNKKYGIKPKSIKKPIRERLIEEDELNDIDKLMMSKNGKVTNLTDIENESLTPMDRRRLLSKLRKEMKLAARDLNFELAAIIRDKIFEINRTLLDK